LRAGTDLRLSPFPNTHGFLNPFRRVRMGFPGAFGLVDRQRIRSEGLRVGRSESASGEGGPRVGPRPETR